MASYVYLQHYTSQGDLGISKEVFVTLGQHVIDYVKEHLNDDKLEISNDVEVNIKNNKAYYKFLITSKGKANTKKIETYITDYINSNLLMICDNVPFEISIKITTID